MTDVHALVVPYPGQGHINPMMHLAKKLASKGVTVTFVLTDSWHKIITEANAKTGGRDAFAHAHSLGLDIRLARIPDCLPSEFDRASNFSHFYSSLANMEKPVEDLLIGLEEQNINISCIVADTFLPWPVPLAKRRNLRSVSFFPQCVSVFSITYHLELVKTEAESVTCIPGISPLSVADLPLVFFVDRDKTSVPDIVACSFQNVREADWVVANSFEGLEGRAVKVLWPKIRVYCVGPLLPSAYLEGFDPRDTVVGTSSRVEADCKQWLDARPRNSVVFVSFGSLCMNKVSQCQLTEIAMGLKESGYSFLWVLRPANEKEEEASDVLPPGYMEDTEGRALVVPWCRQLEVLSHPAVGGFLTHCGWNSCVESISCGVPILGFPLGVDQFTDCKLVVEEWKVGLRLRGRYDELVGREDISKRVRALMEGEEMRREAERLRDIARTEVSSGGRSATNLDALVNGLKDRETVIECVDALESW